MFIKRDRSDEMFYREFLSESEKLQAVVKEGVERHYAYEDISQDIYTMLYEPKPVDETAPTPVGLRIAKQNLDKIKELREYQELHRLTALDSLAAGFATEAMGKQFIGLLPKVKENPEELKQRAQSADELAQGCAGAGDHQAAQAYMDASDELNAKAQTIEDYLGKVDPRVMDDEACRQKMREALQGALKDTRDALEGMGAFGYDNDPGAMKQQGLKEKLELAKRLRESEKLKEIAKLAGRFIRIAKKKQKEKMTSNVVSSVRMGDTLARTLPSELGKLANPTLAPTFFKSWTEKTLLEYNLEGKVPQGQGPIVYLHDGSGSMAGYPEMSVKAIGMALAEVAKKEKRDFVMGQFSSKGQYREIQILANGSVVVEDGKHGTETHPYNPLYLMAELEFFFNGGTDFETPLRAAVQHIAGNRFQRADIIFATDGMAEISDAFMKEYAAIKEEKKFSCLGVLVGRMPDAKGAPGVMQKFCDEMFCVDDLLSDEDANTNLHERMFKI